MDPIEKETELIAHCIKMDFYPEKKEQQFRNWMPSESQNMFQINPRRSSEREITILSFSLFSESTIFQLEKLSTKIFLMNSIRILFYSW